MLKAIADGEVEGFTIKDEVKLHRVAGLMGIDTEGKDVSTLAGEVADVAIAQFGQQTGELVYVSRAPEKRQKLWRDLGVVPRGIDREVVQALHSTAPGNDQNVEHLLDTAARCALSSGWGGSMLATDLQDIVFGTPTPVRSAANLGVLAEDQVNILIHGHEPLLSSVVIDIARSDEMQELARSKGAAGINVAGICCTANEALMRQGVPPAGNMLHQELAVLTGAVEAMVVDVQCIFQGLADVAGNFHTLLISTSQKAKVGEGGMHVEADEHHPQEAAREIVRRAVENFENREETHIPAVSEPLVAGFSHEYIRYMLGGKMRASFRPLNDNIINGRIRGLAAVVGCSNPRTMQDASVIHDVRELTANNVLVVVTGCAAITSGKHGLLSPETAEYAGDGLASVCETVGIPPVLHLGSCVDNSRILTILSEVVEEGGLGEDIAELPAVGISPEWFSEKALEIATYAVASGVHVIFGGVGSPVSGSPTVVEYMLSGWKERYGGKLEFLSDPQDIVTSTLDTIDAARAALKIDVPQERVLFDMDMRRELSV
jgi:carbon-monoxide dehydrogenase catalytic subunit